MSQETIRAAERAAGQVNAMSTYDPDSDQLHEECGIFGVWAPDRDVARLTYFGLRALQHRGQDAAGILGIGPVLGRHPKLLRALCQIDAGAVQLFAALSDQQAAAFARVLSQGMRLDGVHSLLVQHQ